MNEHDDVLRELGKQLPWDRPEDARREALRSSLLDAATVGEARAATRWSVIGGAFAAGAVAAAAVILVVIHNEHPTAGNTSAGNVSIGVPAQIDASPSALFERQVTQTPRGTDEIVRVHGGKVSLAVGALAIGDRVRVATRDAEVEGEGSYEVAVVGDRIREVRVAQGRATVRLTGQQAVFLAAGETWHATVITAAADLVPPAAVATAAPARPAGKPSTPMAADPAAKSAVAVSASSPPDDVTPETHTHTRAIADAAPPALVTGDVRSNHTEPAARVSPPTATTTTAATAPAPSEAIASVPEEARPSMPTEAPIVERPKDQQTTTEKHLRSGWQLLKSGRSAEAARDFGLAADAGGDDPLAADARYFQAIALTKAGRKTEAEHALVAFLDHAKQTIRRGRAAVMLARLIAERGDAKSARAWFETALHDPDASVAAAAKAGLDGLRE